MDDSSVNFGTMKNLAKNEEKSLVQKLMDESSIKEAGEFGLRQNIHHHASL